MGKASRQQDEWPITNWAYVYIIGHPQAVTTLYILFVMSKIGNVKGESGQTHRGYLGCLDSLLSMEQPFQHNMMQDLPLSAAFPSALTFFSAENEISG